MITVVAAETRPAHSLKQKLCALGFALLFHVFDVSIGYPER
jgi:hypothetical protein